MLKKPIPIKLSAAANDAVQKQLGVQVAQKAAPKSTDPINFPVFEVQTGKKVLIYVPNHVVDGPDGPELRMDKPLIHAVQDGKRFLYYRCVSGIALTDENGNTIYDGSCPLCDGTNAPWELANKKIEQKCRQLGLEPDDKENTQVKAIRSAEFSSRVLKEANRYYTFPIVVISTVNDDGKTILKDENGNPTLTPMWYHISEAQYNKKWKACLEGMEDEPTHPGGHFFILSFVYDTKGKEANKRDAAQNLTVIAKNPKGSDKLKALLDERTEAWTPEKAQETVITNQLYSLRDLQEITDTVLMPTNDLLSLLNAAEASKELEGSSGDFNLKAPETKAISDTSSVATMDETDEDEDDGMDFQ